MEGMILSEALVIQAECVDLGSCSLSLDNWSKGLAIKLLEATHGLLNMLGSVGGGSMEHIV